MHPTRLSDGNLLGVFIDPEDIVAEFLKRECEVPLSAADVQDSAGWGWEGRQSEGEEVGNHEPLQHRLWVGRDIARCTTFGVGGVFSPTTRRS